MVQLPDADDTRKAERIPDRAKFTGRNWMPSKFGNLCISFKLTLLDIWTDSPEDEGTLSLNNILLKSDSIGNIYQWFSTKVPTRINCVVVTSTMSTNWFPCTLPLPRQSQHLELLYSDLFIFCFPVPVRWLLSPSPLLSIYTFYHLPNTCNCFSILSAICCSSLRNNV